ncbi:MAG: inorganic phosphate transporter [Polaromonas sp.]
MEYLLIGVAVFLAFGNGANDNFKGFATVWGTDSLSYRQALLLATAATIAGSLLSLVLAQGLVQQFSGKGLLPQGLVEAPSFLISVGMGAALTVMIATRVGLPISTTHALIGGLVGAGLAANPDQLQFAKLGNTFIVPLLLSPLLAAALGLLTYKLLRLRPTQVDCACITVPQATVLATELALPAAASPRLVLASNAACDLPGVTGQAVGFRVSISRLFDRLHVFSASLICFARAVNDTPKLAALLVASHMLSAQVSLVMMAAAMALGGLLLSRRVAQTMSQRVTRMNPSQGLAANLITSTLVLSASQFALPVSTTHVSVGAIAGVGAGGNTLNRTSLRSILLSWLATLPMAGCLAWLTFKVI